MLKQNLPPRTANSGLSSSESLSLQALMAYVADQLGQSTTTVQQNLAHGLQLGRSLVVPPAKYDEAVRYLVDLLPPSSSAQR